MIALDIAGVSKNELIMYADDGIIDLTEGGSLLQLRNKLTNIGVKINYEKSGIIDGPFKFLGIKWDGEK